APPDSESHARAPRRSRRRKFGERPGTRQSDHRSRQRCSCTAESFRCPNAGEKTIAFQSRLSPEGHPELPCECPESLKSNTYYIPRRMKAIVGLSGIRDRNLSGYLSSS